MRTVRQESLKLQSPTIDVPPQELQLPPTLENFLEVDACNICKVPFELTSHRVCSPYLFPRPSISPSLPCLPALVTPVWERGPIARLTRSVRLDCCSAATLPHLRQAPLRQLCGQASLAAQADDARPVSPPPSALDPPLTLLPAVPPYFCSTVYGIVGLTLHLHLSTYDAHHDGHTAGCRCATRVSRRRFTSS